MPSDTQTAPVSKKSLWAGRIMSALVILFLALDVAFKFVKPAPAPVVETFARLGWPLSLGPVLGIRSRRDPADWLSWWRHCHAPTRRRSTIQPCFVPNVFGRAALGWSLLARTPAPRPHPATNSEGALVVPRSMEHFHRVRQQVRHRFQRFHRALWASRQVYNKRFRSHRRGSAR